jgi:hypothetical protein
MGNFQKLRVWQLAKDLAVKIYKLTQGTGLPKDFGFKDQIQRSNKQSIHFFYIAKGSAAELLTQIIIGQEIGYINKQDADLLINDCKLISVMLTKLIRTRSI